MLDTVTIRKDFPIFQNRPGLVYLDSTATSLKPLSVINALNGYYRQYSANIYRGIYELSEQATGAYENARSAVARFIHAAPGEIVFTRNTTESINLAAYSFVKPMIRNGSQIATTVMEHHSNFVPWQQIAMETGSLLRVIPVVGDGALDMDNLDRYIKPDTVFLAVAWVSNVLGTANDVKRIIREAKRISPRIVTLVDAAQGVPHRKTDVQDLGCDFLAFSGHKMLGPTGIGVLWGRQEILAGMKPFLYGGEMISEVHIQATKFKDPPHRFEAGTPAIGEAIALGEAVRYLEKTGSDAIHDHEKELAAYAVRSLRETFRDIRIVGPATGARGGIVSFTFGAVHPHDVSQILAERQICVRAGNHCAMPLHEHLGLDATVRASFYLYNSREDVDALIDGLKRVASVFKTA